MYQLPESTGRPGRPRRAEMPIVRDSQGLFCRIQDILISGFTLYFRFDVSCDGLWDTPLALSAGPIPTAQAAGAGSETMAARRPSLGIGLGSHKRRPREAKRGRSSPPTPAPVYRPAKS